MADSTFAVLNLGSQRVSGAVFGRARGGDLILKNFAFAEMQGDPTVEATRLPQLRIAVLELARVRRISVEQSWPFAEMRIYRGERFTDDRPLDDAAAELVAVAAEEGESE